MTTTTARTARTADISPLPQDGHDLAQDVDGGAGVVELAAAVVADDDAGEAELGGAEGVVGALDALEEDGQGRDGAEPGQVGPGQGRVDEG